jgi:hypothetical protein
MSRMAKDECQRLSVPRVTRAFQYRGFLRAEACRDDEPRLSYRGEGQGEPARRWLGGIVHRSDKSGALLEQPVVRKERSDVSVQTPAKQHQVEDRRCTDHADEVILILAGSSIEIRLIRWHPVYLMWTGRTEQSDRPREVKIGIRPVGRAGALVGPEEWTRSQSRVAAASTGRNASPTLPPGTAIANRPRASMDSTLALRCDSGEPPGEAIGLVSNGLCDQAHG